MELRHLRYFVAVGEDLNFSRAAERLGIAQPPLSQQIQRLERELGVRLFVRTHRRVELSDVGRALLDDARRTLVQADRFVDIARRAARGEAGSLRLGFSSAALYTMVPAILRAFLARAPEVTLNLLERSSEEQIEMLAAGAIDAGFVRLPIVKPAPALSLRTIVREPLLVALSYGHRLANRRAVALRALAAERFIIVARSAARGLHDQIVALCRRAGFEPVIAQEAAEVSTIVSLVSAGLGVAIVPASVRNLQRERVTYHATTGGTAMTEMALAYDRDNRSRVLLSFLEVADKIIAH
jgi:DNA-binding transcriptional LysR family regulator